MFTKIFDSTPTPYTLSAKTSVAEEKSSPLCMVLDIDETLVSGVCYKLPADSTRDKFIAEMREKLIKKYPSFKDNIFEDRVVYKGMDLVGFHIPHPGMKEFLYNLFMVQKAKVIFYSAGSEDRNKLLVPHLLTYALGEENYKKVLSEKRCKIASIPRDKPKKDLLDVLDNEDSIDETVFVENNPNHMIFSQKRNMLVVQTAEETDLCEVLEANDDGTLGLPSLIAANHLFYATGLLMKALATKGKDGVANQLYKLQYESGYEPTIHLEPWEYYEAGLKELQKINSSLKFFKEKEFLMEYNSVAPVSMETIAPVSTETIDINPMRFI